MIGKNLSLISFFINSSNIELIEKKFLHKSIEKLMVYVYKTIEREDILFNLFSINPNPQVFIDLDALGRDNLCQIRAFYLILLTKEYAGKYKLLPQSHKLAIGLMRLLTQIKIQPHYLDTQKTNLLLLEKIAIESNSPLSGETLNVFIISVMNKIILNYLTKKVPDFFLPIQEREIIRQCPFLCPLPQFFHSYKLIFQYANKGKLKIISIHLLYSKKDGLVDLQFFYPNGQPTDTESSLIIVSYQIKENDSWKVIEIENFRFEQFKDNVLTVAAVHKQFVRRMKQEKKLNDIEEIKARRRQAVHLEKQWELTPYQDEKNKNFAFDTCSFNIFHVFAGTLKTANLYRKRVIEGANHYQFMSSSSLLKDEVTPEGRTTNDVKIERV